jgi:hypothetical protein
MIKWKINKFGWREPDFKKPVENPIELEREIMNAREVQEVGRSRSQMIFSGGNEIISQIERMQNLYNQTSSRLQEEMIQHQAMREMEEYRWEIMIDGNEKIVYGKEEMPEATPYQLRVEVVSKNSAYGDTRKFWYENNRGAVISMDQDPFPHCCGICILHNFSFDASITQEMFNDCLSEIIKVLRDNDHFGKILIYTSSETFRQEKLFQNYPNIVILDKFINPRTDHHLAGFEIDL